jgi:3-hydroxy acid dehydrogenase / malonic semialdehyde reductase
MSISLANKIVFITGASSGIGAAAAHAFASHKTRLLLAARRNEKLDALKPKLLAAGAAAVHAIELDVRDHVAVAKAIESLPKEWQSIEILVNNAGLSRGLDPLQDGHLKDWEEMIDTNVKGLLYVTRAVVPGMIARNSGHVISLGSTAGHVTYPKGAVYCATKAAERVISEGLRQDVLGTPVRVTSVDPGMVETEFSEVRFRGDQARAAKVYQGLTPLQPEDVADAIVWAATRPAHVNIAEVQVTSIDQANSLLFNRK